MIEHLDRALAARRALDQPELPEQHAAPVRVFNGYTEGWPGLVVERFGHALVVQANEPVRADLVQHLVESWIEPAVVLWKNRMGDPASQRGTVVYGAFAALPTRTIEHGVHYSLDLRLNRDASFYLDTRPVRRWLGQHAIGRSVLNAFAYTGSLGVAAAVAPARRVVQTDRTRHFLEVAKRSYGLNRLTISRRDFVVGDFFEACARWRRERLLFDIVVIDPPVRSNSPRGTVDLLHQYARLLNKIRPLVSDGGTIIAINNALYLSGGEYLTALSSLCADGYLELTERIDVAADVVGLERVTAMPWPVDPAPFNYPTKIAILWARRRDHRRASP
jgi:23S rRNA (cytosine1962-C5)-methyltransferase